MILIAVSIGILLITVVLAPFFVGQGGRLQEASSINAPGKLTALKEAILKRYLEDEAGFAQGNLSRVAWNKRRQFLINRYIDAARRLDFLEGAEKAAALDLSLGKERSQP